MGRVPLQVGGCMKEVLSGLQLGVQPLAGTLESRRMGTWLFAGYNALPSLGRWLHLHI